MPGRSYTPAFGPNAGKSIDTSTHNDGGLISNLYHLASGFVHGDFGGGDPVQGAQKGAQADRSATIDKQVSDAGG